MTIIVNAKCKNQKSKLQIKMLKLANFKIILTFVHFEVLTVIFNFDF